MSKFLLIYLFFLIIKNLNNNIMTIFISNFLKNNNQFSSKIYFESINKDKIIL